MAGAPDLAVVLAAVALPFAAVPVVPLAHRLVGERVGYLGAAVAVASFALLAGQHGRSGTVGVPWIPRLDAGLRFHVDAWGLLFALLASGVGVFVFTYSVSYMHGEPSLERYYGALLAFMGSILGVALAADLLALFVFWELTSVCSFVLIGHHQRDPESRDAARMAMFVTVGGGLAFLFGVLLLRAAADPALGGATFDLAAMLAEPEAMQEALRERGHLLPLLSLLAVGAGAKSAQVPLHFWLPNAMAAPTPVSAFLHSATMVKVGVYLLGRLRPILVGPEWTALFATVGLVTMTVTAVLAVAATDVKELLAYSTASHLGLMVAGFGFASDYGAAAGTFHLLNHAAFKAALFLVAGVVAHQAGTRRLDEVGGLARDLPVTALITAVAALSMAGVPPFNGFYSKELLFEAAYEAGHAAGGLAWLWPVLATVASAFTVLYSLRFLAMFVGDRPSGLGTVQRPPLGLLAPPAVLALLAGGIGAAPGVAVDAIVGGATASTGGDPSSVHVGLPSHVSPAVLMTAVAVAAGVAAYPSYGRLQGGIRRLLATTPALTATRWYDLGLDGLQWTASAAVPRIQTGSLRAYVEWLLATACLLAIGGYVVGGVGVPELVLLEGPLAVVVVLLVAVVAAASLTAEPSHAVGVLLLSVVGLLIAIVYILASAPDLALTQLVVETLTLLVFLLVIEELPAYYATPEPSVALRDALLSTGVGATVFATVLIASGGADSVLAPYFTEQAVPGAGGTNVVNVILVDFRGLDTLGESVVVVLAALGVLTLIISRDRREQG